MNKLFQDLKFKVFAPNFEKTVTKDGKRIISGYASTYGNIDRQNELISREALEGAREDLLNNRTIFFNHNHNDLPIGVCTDCILDDKGLLIEVEISSAGFCDDIWTLIEEGALNSFSIGGVVLDGHDERDDDGKSYHVIDKISILETSVVGIPANPEAKFALSKSLSFNSAIAEQIKLKEGSKKMAKQDKQEVAKTEEPKKEAEKVEEPKNDEAASEKVSEETKEEVKDKEDKQEEVKEEKVESEKKEDKAEESENKDESEDSSEEKVEEEPTLEAGKKEEDKVEDSEEYKEEAKEQVEESEAKEEVAEESESIAEASEEASDVVEEEASDEVVEKSQSQETSLEKESEEVEETIEDAEEEKSDEKEEEKSDKSVEEKILDTLTLILDKLSDLDKKEIEEKKDETDSEKAENKEETETESTEEKQEEYTCECLECGEVIKTSEHCRDIKCPKCGGEMRRQERPGVGKDAETKEEKKVEEKVVEKKVETKEEKIEKKEEVPTRKSIAVVAPSPYEEAIEKKEEKSQEEVDREKNLKWAEIFFGKKIK